MSDDRQDDKQDHKKQEDLAPEAAAPPAAEADSDTGAEREGAPPEATDGTGGGALPPGTRTQRRRGGRGGLLLALLALLLGATALALSAFLYLEEQDEEQDDRLAPLQRELGELRDAHRQLTEALEQGRAEQRSQRERLSETREELQRRQLELEQRQLRLGEQLQELTHSDRRDWLLAEAEYLMRLAGQRLLLAQDPRGTLRLLASADNILAELDDGGLNPVRAALADEISALRAATGIDREGRYFQLQAVARRAQDLKLYLTPGREVDEPGSTTEDEQSEAGRPFRALADALSRLGNYIRLERREEAYRPLISPLQENALRYSLQLQFEQAQLALLAGDTRLYRHALERAAEWIDRYYQLDERAAGVVAQIDELREQPVSVELPDISTSLRRLRQYRNTVEGGRRTEDDSA